jgi:hypothetical protein
MSHYTALDKRSEYLFESMVQYLKGRNTTVILFLSPYHPIVYRKILADPRYAQVAQSESYFRRFAAEEHILVIGSYDPGLLNLTSGKFYDGMHLRRETINQLFAGPAPAISSSAT